MILITDGRSPETESAYSYAGKGEHTENGSVSLLALRLASVQPERHREAQKKRRMQNASND
jgi:hypothetical protein